MRPTNSFAAAAVLALAATAIPAQVADAQIRLDKALPKPVGPELPPQIRDGVRITSTEHRWDFEDGTLQGFTRGDDPEVPARFKLTNQPTLGDAIATSQATDVSAIQLGAAPCAGLVLDELTTCEYGPEGRDSYYLTALRNSLSSLRAGLDRVGGDYAERGFPIGKQGKYWIGTSANRPSAAAVRARGIAGSTTFLPAPEGGDNVRGRLISPVVRLQERYFSMLVGGGCTNDVGVYLQTEQTEFRRESRDINQPIDPGSVGRENIVPVRVWRTVNDSRGRPVAARGVCLENMRRVVFDISNLSGVNARVLIEDNSAAPWGHINVDDIRISREAPPYNTRETDPVFGFADLHAHLMNEMSYGAYDPSGLSFEARALWGSANGPIENLRRCNDLHTTRGSLFESVLDTLNGSDYTLCRDICLNLLEGAGLPEKPDDGISQDPLGGYHNTNGGYPNFTYTPEWFSAIHQQMHWSWVKRAYDGGLRLMVASVGNSEVISFALAKERDRQFTSDQDAIAMQIPAIKEFARTNNTWAEVAYTPREARRIINSGKMAIVIGLELDHFMDSCNADATRQSHHRSQEYSHPDVWVARNGADYSLGAFAADAAQVIGARTRVMNVAAHPDSCTQPQIDARVNALYEQGVRQIIPMHFSDNLFGGYAITDGLFYASAIFGDSGARAPTLMSAEQLIANYGERARAFTPVAREASYGENERRRREWEQRRPIHNKVAEMSVPIWTYIAPYALLDPEVLPPDVSRNITEFFMGRCISDDGWRAFAAFFSGGLSEAACAATTITEAAIDEARNSLPYEGALDTAAMIPIPMTGDQNALAFHVNSKSLTSAYGVPLIQSMKKRGMLIDIQHSSDLTKNAILDLTPDYPVMASHGGAEIGGSRENENALSAAQLRRVNQGSGFVGGIVGVGVQNADGVVDQVRNIAAHGGPPSAENEPRPVALGTDINGMDWHSPPRFGPWSVWNSRHPETRFVDDRGPLVRYSAYDASTNPWTESRSRVAGNRPLNPLQVSSGGRVVRTFDVNFDGLANYGLLPDFLQEVSVLGASPPTAGRDAPEAGVDMMASLMRSSEGTIRMWEESCYAAYHSPTPAPNLVTGCGPRSDYP